MEKTRKKNMVMTNEDIVRSYREAKDRCDQIKVLAEYEKALRTKYVINPLAWALYHTWEKVHKSTGGAR